MQYRQDSIAAIATAQGRGGVGIVRVSGPLAATLCQQICQLQAEPRVARYGNFYDEQNRVLDQGISIFFSGTKFFYRRRCTGIARSWWPSSFRYAT